ISPEQWEILGTSSGEFRCISRDCPAISLSWAGNNNREPSISTRGRTSSSKTVLPHPKETVGGPQSCKWLSWGLQGTAGGHLEGHPHRVSQESAPAGHSGISPSSSGVHLIQAKTAGWSHLLEQCLLPIQHVPGADFLHVFTLRMHFGPARNVKV
uniref:Uncharacterized protein n=1 Tax=Nomascus leucogenys TaxID=61853 RepID=G1QQR6_NOMLE